MKYWPGPGWNESLRKDPIQSTRLVWNYRKDSMQFRAGWYVQKLITHPTLVLTLDLLKTYKSTPNILTLLGYILAVRTHNGEQQTLAPQGVTSLEPRPWLIPIRQRHQEMLKLNVTLQIIPFYLTSLTLQAS
jgi:hypothetical protein